MPRKTTWGLFVIYFLSIRCSGDNKGSANPLAKNKSNPNSTIGTNSPSAVESPSGAVDQSSPSGENPNSGMRSISDTANTTQGVDTSENTKPSLECPTGYILVPGDSDYQTSNFCVMKYEAKFGSNGVESRAAGLPARGNISQMVAQSSCKNLGNGYFLISNAEWMTLASNIASVAANWSGGSVGSGALNTGHDYPIKVIAAVTDDNDACNGTGIDCSASVWNSQRRTHVLSNNNVIWDLAGNVWEWVDYNNPEDKPSPAGGWIEFTEVTGSTVMAKTELVPTQKTWWVSSWNSANGLGQYNGGKNGFGGGLLRGGHVDYGNLKGVFAADLRPDPSDVNFDTRVAPIHHLGYGFRCVFRFASL